MIYVECYPDHSLVKSLANIAKREIIHEFKGKGEICNRLRRQTNCKGLVDEDPSSGQPRYVKEAELEDDFPEHEIKVLYHSSTDNRLIVLCPRLEEWILRAASEAGIDVRKFNLSNNAVRLHSEINISIDEFENLLGKLKGKSSRLKTLKKLIEKA
jgi:hypothetical protein